MVSSTDLHNNHQKSRLKRKSNKELNKKYKEIMDEGITSQKPPGEPASPLAKPSCHPCECIHRPERRHTHLPQCAWPGAPLCVPLPLVARSGLVLPPIGDRSKDLASILLRLASTRSSTPQLPAPSESDSRRW
jgi:hypothetical protein